MSRVLPDVVWITATDSEAKHLRAQGISAQQLSLWTILRAEYLFVNDSPAELVGTIYLLGRFSIVQLWHGTPIKKICFDLQKHQSFRLSNILARETYSKFVLITCNDTETQQIFKRAFRNPNVQVLGYPRNDLFFDERLRDSRLHSELALSSSKDVLLFCPTFRDTQTGTLLSDVFLEAISRLVVDFGKEFLIKRHPADRRCLPKHLPSGVRDVTDQTSDLQQLLVESALLITDYSSVTFDFVLTGKPIIFYCNDVEEYLRDNRDFYYSYFNDFPGPFAKTESELLELLRCQNEWSNDTKYRERYAMFRDRFNQHQDAEAATRIAEYLEIELG